MPEQRFAEDKLRMLRAVRFAAAFDFALEPATQAAIAADGRRNPRRQPRTHRHGDAADARRAGRVRAVRLLLETHLAAAVLPEIVPHDEPQRRQFERALAALGRLDTSRGFR